MVKMVIVVLCAFYRNRKKKWRKQIVTVSNSSDRSKGTDHFPLKHEQ